MTTPIIMLVLMTTPYLVFRLVSAARKRRPDPRPAAALGLALLFTFTAIGHFVKTEAMVAMLPTAFPARTFLVYATGVLEFLIAAGFLFPRTRRLAGQAAVTALLLFFPINVYAALNNIPMGGHAWGPLYLLIRGPLQLAIVLWTFWFVLRPRTSTA